jgi:3-dehydroquinate synthase
MSVEKFQALMALDKKNANGKLRLILLKGELGECIFTGDFDSKMLYKTLQVMCDEKSD